MKEILIALILLAGIKSYQYQERASIQTLATRWEQDLAEHGIKFGKVVAAQAILETGKFRSKIYRENNNPFGMKFNSRGYAYAKKNGHAAYNSVADAFLDYKVWQDKCLSKVDIQSDEEYLEMLDNLPICEGCRYAEDPLYTKKLRKIIKKITK